MISYSIFGSSQKHRQFWRDKTLSQMNAFHHFHANPPSLVV